MSTEQTTPAEATNETGEQSPVPPTMSRPAIHVVLGHLLVVMASMVVAIWYISNVRERAVEQIDADLSETYGVPIERVDMRFRDGAPSLWSVDGQERECILARDPYTLRCQNGDGAFAEVEQVSK